MANDIYVKNRYNISIKKCCASCSHCQPESEKLRVCDAGEGIVSPKSLCAQWVMKPGLNNAGKGGGKIIKLHYIDFMIKKQEEENARIKAARCAGIREKPTPVEVFAKEYEETFETRFITDF